MLRLGLSRAGAVIRPGPRRVPASFAAASSKSWVPDSPEEMEKMVIQSTISKLEDHASDAAGELVPWFFENMPTAYFNAVDDAARMVHMRALAALCDSGIPPELTIRDPHNSRITFIQPAPGATQEQAAAALGSSFSEPVDSGVMARLGSSYGDPSSSGGGAPLEKGTSTNILIKNLRELPGGDKVGMLTGVGLFSSRDHTLMLNTFSFGHFTRFSGASKEQQEARAKLIAYADENALACAVNDSDAPCGVMTDAAGKPMPAPSPMFETSALDEYLSNCSADYVVRSNTRRFLLQRELYEKVRGTEAVEVHMEHSWGVADTAADAELQANAAAKSRKLHMVTIAAPNVQPRAHLTKLGQYLTLFDLDVVRAHLDIVADPSAGAKSHVTLIRLLCEAPEHMGNTDWGKLASGIKRLKWLDDSTLDLVMEHKVDNNGTLDLLHAEVVTALCSMLHGVLAKTNQYAFARARIFDMVRDPRVLPCATDIASLFLEKFDPATGEMDEHDFDERASELIARIRHDVESEDSQLLLEKMLDAVRATLKTNAFVDTRFALALRMDPAILGVNDVVGTDIPFGSLFVHGRRFNGFHCRFRDISRGGLRVVLPQSREQHAMESARQYDEVYSLAYAQQLKNKDIPEGGSKAVVLVDCPVDAGRDEQFSSDEDFRHYVVRKSVKAFSDAVLDMLSTHEHVRNQIVDYYKRPELIYLGPDENIIPQDINWMIANAHRRGYPIPNAFMSSKPDAGINHKEYGVTSEGVAVFTDVALHAAGFKPREPGNPFTVKITGGPDGDVAGNIINILWREYGENVCIVGIADGTGCAEDPEGLDIHELLRLFQEELPIEHFDGSKLSPEGILHDIKTTEGVRARNTMHNRVHADVFIPAGGRPATVNEVNCEDFLLPDGTPSSKLVVEGANLFFTPPARQALFDKAGVVIVKDSSANKCGVITSSFEIMASMMLEPDEFLRHKDGIVEDTLARLRSLARVEAELLFREHKRDSSTALPHTSQRISHCITRVHDAVSNALQGISDGSQWSSLQSLVEEHLPDTLLEVSRDRIAERVPREYIDQVIASALACKIVYKEGLAFIEAMPDASLSAVAFDYLESEKRISSLIEEINASDIESKEAIVDLLVRGGARVGIDKANTE